MITIRDVSKSAADRIIRLLGPSEFTVVGDDGDLYGKVSCSDNIGIAFMPSRGYVILESPIGQADIYTNEFSTITIL